MTAASASAIAQAPADLIALVARALPSVVQISTTRPAAPRKPAPEMNRETEEFFERFMSSRTPAANQPRQVGSGVIIAADGYVLTAEYIVDPGDTVTVRLFDGRALPATLVGKDRRGGVALLKIEASGLAAAAPGDPRKLRLAERVFALGGVPGGRTGAVTDGIVSALDVEEGQAGGYIQTTVALHPAMGGGPLYNLAGELVGVNAMLYTRVSGGSLSFALPIDDALAIVKELRASGRVRRGTLGVSVQEVTADIAATYGMEQPAGALISEVRAGSGAQQAGLAKGDIVTRFQGEALRSSAQLIRFFAKTKPGERITLRVRRSKDVPERDLAVVLGEAPD